VNPDLCRCSFKRDILYESSVHCNKRTQFCTILSCVRLYEYRLWRSWKIVIFNQLFVSYFSHIHSNYFNNIISSHDRSGVTSSDKFIFLITPDHGTCNNKNVNSTDYFCMVNYNGKCNILKPII
jgi:hypothetical protein